MGRDKRMDTTKLSDEPPRQRDPALAALMRRLIAKSVEVVGPLDGDAAGEYRSDL